jgi:hypothetical protein
MPEILENLEQLLEEGWVDLLTYRGQPFCPTSEEPKNENKNKKSNYSFN